MKNSLIPLILVLVLFAFGCNPSKKSQTGTSTPVEQVAQPDNEEKIECKGIDKGEAMWKDPIANMLAEIKGDFLHLKVSYSGGCKEHDFALVWSGAMSKSIPPQVSLDLAHNSHEDMCEAIVTQKLCFDLKELKLPGQNTVIIRLQANGFSTQQLSFRY